MKNHRSIWLVPAVAALLAVSVSLAAAPSTDISWIGRLPGVSNAVQSQDGDSIKVVYSLTGDPERTLQRLYDGLDHRGWIVRKSGLAALGVMSFQAVRATKGKATLNIALADEGATRALMVTLQGGTTDPPNTMAESSVSVEGRGNRGGRVVIQDESGNTVTTDGEGRVVARDGSGQTAVFEPGRVTAKDSGGQTVVLEPGRVTAKDSGGRTAVVGTGDASAAGRRIVINDDNVARRIRCDAGTDILLNGDECKLTLEGDCHALSIQGDDNRADVLGAIESIGVLGDNNLVTWSADADPAGPRIQNLGDDNVVRSSSH